MLKVYQRWGIFKAFYIKIIDIKKALSYQKGPKIL